MKDQNDSEGISPFELLLDKFADACDDKNSESKKIVTLDLIKGLLARPDLDINYRNSRGHPIFNMMVYLGNKAILDSLLESPYRKEIVIDRQKKEDEAMLRWLVTSENDTTDLRSYLKNKGVFDFLKLDEEKELDIKNKKKD